MKIERTKNASRNIVFGSLLKIYQILVPFFMRTAMIYLLGVEYLGLNSLFTSILQVLNLTELGVGSAMVYSMYVAIANNDKTKICALMKLYKIYYRIIGIVIAIIGMGLLPFIPNLITGDVPSDINVYILYVLNLGATVVSYWLFAYKTSLLKAYQRLDVISKVTIITDTVKYVLQLLVLAIFKDYYLYVIVLLLSQAINNIVNAIIVTKMYPEYKAKGELELIERKEINHRIRDLFTSRIGSVIVNSADSIVISAFLGITILAIYQNYYFIFTSVTSFILIIFTSVTAGIGNSLITETKEKNFNDFKKLSFLIFWITGVCATLLLTLYQPFMKLWVGERLTLDFSIVICLVTYFVIFQFNSLFNMYKDAAGMWHEDRFRPLVTALSNLIMNIILVNIIGLYGIILSTILSFVLIGIPWLFHNLFTTLFEKNLLKQYLKLFVKYLITILISCIICCCVCSLFNFSNFITLIVNGITALIITNIMYFIIYRKTTEFRESVELIDRITKNKLRLKDRLT